MQISNKRRSQSNYEGRTSESRFHQIFKDAIPSSQNENMYDHVDFWMSDGRGVDVKGKNHPHEIWLEIKNVQGKNGWLYGKADFIAFEMYELGGFACVDTEQLREFVAKNVKKEYTTKDKAYLKLYRREGRMDTITKVTICDLTALDTFVVFPYCREYIHPETGERISF